MTLHHQLGKQPMQRVSLSWVIENFASISKILEIEPGISGAAGWLPLFDTQQKVSAILASSVYSGHFRISGRKGDQFQDAVKPIIQKLLDDQSYSLTDVDIWTIKNAARELKTVLLSELESLPTYLVTLKENYEIDRLIDFGRLLFPQNMIDKAPETFEDAQEAGKCLAFERNTACGFHTFRVVESVVRRYWDTATGGKPRPNPETLGNIAGQLKINAQGDPKIYETLTQMAKLHRNPIAHPEVILTGDEAIGILGIARSAVTVMLQHLPDVPPTTSSSTSPFTSP